MRVLAAPLRALLGFLRIGVGKRKDLTPMSVLAFLLSCNVASVDASVINFDNIDASFGDVSLDAISPYQGLTWSNFFAYTSDPSFPGFNNGIVSQSNAAYSGGETFGATVTPVIGKIQSVSPFDFVSGYVGAGYYDALNVTVQGLLAGNVVFNKTITVGTFGAQLVDFGFSNIDELDFFGTQTAQTTDPFLCGSQNCTQFTLDDLTFAPASSVPEPSSLALFGLSMAAAWFVRRKAPRIPKNLEQSRLRFATI